MFGVSLLAAHENRDAIMRARDDQLVAQGVQARRAPTAKAVSQHNRLNVGTRVHRLEIFLQLLAELIRPVMQTHLQEAHFRKVAGPARQERDFFFKYRAGQQGDFRSRLAAEGWSRRFHSRHH